MTRQELIKKVETYRPPIKVVVSADDKKIDFENVPMQSGRHQTFVVNLKDLSETPEQYLQSLIDEDEARACTVCGKSVGGFKDELSAKEFTISGFCQACQDKTFNAREVTK